jgi:hypothetical protein
MVSFGFLRLHRRNTSNTITNTKVPIIPPAIPASGNVTEEDLALAVAESSEMVDDEVCDIECEGAKRGVASVVVNSNLSNSNSLLPFVVESRFVITAVWKVFDRRGVSKYNTLKIADPFDLWEVTLGGPPSIVNCTEFFPFPPGTVPQTRNE